MALIPELPEKTTVHGTDLLVIDDGTHTYKLPWSTLISLLNVISSFEADPDTEHYPGYIKLTLANGNVLRARVSDPDKQNKLTFDNRPVKNSTNPVTSGGIFAALDDKLDAEAYQLFRGPSGDSTGSAGIVPAPSVDGMYLGSEGAWTAPDTAPTSGSKKLITSGAAFTALAGKASTKDLNKKYSLPAGGIPKEDLADDVKAAVNIGGGKQDKLIPGENIKTLNGESLLGSGNMEVGTRKHLYFESLPFSSLPRTLYSELITSDYTLLYDSVKDPDCSVESLFCTICDGSITISGKVTGPVSVSLILG